MSSSPRDATLKKSSGVADESVTRATTHQATERESGISVAQSDLRKSPKQTLKPRPSRWADEVDEDDQFIPTSVPIATKSVPPPVEASQSRTRQPIPLRRQVSKEDGRYARNTREQQGYQAKPKPGYDSRSKRETQVVSRPRSPKKPSKEDIEEMAQMKESMARKAEEKKRAKQEEDARIETERRARCDAKLREMEEKQRQKISSGNSSLSSTPVFNQISLDPELESKRSAFNQRRFEVRQKREGKPVIVSSTSPLTPGSPVVGVSSTSPTRLSPHAVEFVPTAHPPPPPAAYFHPMHQQQHMPQHWMPAGAQPPPYYGAPQMWHQWPHGTYGAPHPGYHPHQYPPSPAAPQQYDPREI